MESPLWTAASFALLDDYRAGGFLFAKPIGAIEAREPEDVEPALAALAEAQARGLHAAGFFSYELGYCLEPKLAPLLPAERSVPLLSFGLFEAPERLTPEAVEAVLSARGADEEPYRLSAMHPLWSLEDYRARFEAVQGYIAAGDVYQVNLTFPLSFSLSGSPLRLFGELRRRARGGHTAYLGLEGLSILSLSPELFLEAEGTRLVTRPMKATAPRAPTLARDEAARQALAADAKSRAENLMIVDLLRNDLGRIAKTGSVAVEDLFTVETYPTLHTLTSIVGAERGPGIDLPALLQALFPSGSITGAPKIRAMEIIRALEPCPRGVYCGAIGHLAPDGALKLNVAIRTLTIGHEGRSTLGIGGGLLFDSKLDAEYEECLLKARFLTREDPPFELIETFRWTKAEGYTLLDEHLSRLTDSARYFDFPSSQNAVRTALGEAALAFADDARRVRLTLSETGKIGISDAPLPPAPSARFKAALCAKPVSSADPFLYHKTTRREFYERELARLSADLGADEVLFVNERGEITEGTRMNIFLRRGTDFLTPALDCGLLPGTLRARLISEGKAREAILRPTDLPADPDALYLGNAVRGLMPARFIGAEAPAPVR
jgi:para-aminobenzoate synthetase/4-amino-4-deoxychorismate lyase